MVTWRRVKLIFEEILNEISHPDITMITMEKWTKTSGLRDVFKDEHAGMAHTDYKVFTVRYATEDEKEIRDTIWHEILHIIYPHANHWWIECCAQRLSGSRGRGKFTKRYKRSVQEVPYRVDIINGLKSIIEKRRRWEANNNLKAQRKWINIRVNRVKDTVNSKNWKFNPDENYRDYYTFL